MTAGRKAERLEVDSVSKLYSSGRGITEALRDVDLQVLPGEFICIIGGSGCGKSTLLNLIAGLDTPTSGEIRLGGEPVSAPGPDRTLMFQDAALFPWLNVKKNVEMAPKLQGRSKEEQSEIAQHYLELVHLHGFENAWIHELSGGMRQRVALARCLAANPAVLLMDEPFAALDALTRDHVHDELERAWLETGKTVVFVTHNVIEAVRLADRVILLSNRPGQLKAAWRITLDRPRHAENLEVAEIAATITAQLHKEVGSRVRQRL